MDCFYQPHFKIVFLENSTKISIYENIVYHIVPILLQIILWLFYAETCWKERE